ncbi:MAG: hypothetical protein SGJ11_02005 [Phycisphaerae bacterium]|nr:hypothetical protein [Phycisphaerae bacterium]
MAVWTGLKLVGGVSDFDREPEPPAPLPFAEWAAQLRGSALHAGHQTHHEPHEANHSMNAAVGERGAYTELMSVFDNIGTNINDLAEALGLDANSNHDTDRPRAA